MIELDNKVKSIFKGLVNSGTKYLKSVSSSMLIYKIGNQKITLLTGRRSRDTVSETNQYLTIDRLSNFNTYFYNLGGIGDCIYFTLSIDGVDYYVINGLDRVEEAQILNKLDQTLQEFENDSLNRILSELDDKSLDDEF